MPGRVGLWVGFIILHACCKHGDHTVSFGRQFAVPFRKDVLVDEFLQRELVVRKDGLQMLKEVILDDVASGPSLKCNPSTREQWFAKVRWKPFLCFP